MFVIAELTLEEAKQQYIDSIYNPKNLNKEFWVRPIIYGSEEELLYNALPKTFDKYGQ